MLNSFIHSGNFYIASSSPLLLRGAPDYSIDTVLELTRQSATGNCECSSCPRSLRSSSSEIRTCDPLDAKAPNLPLSHYAPSILNTVYVTMNREKRSMLPLKETKEFRMLTEYDGPILARTSFTTCRLTLPRCPRTVGFIVLPSVLSSPATPEPLK